MRALSEVKEKDFQDSPDDEEDLGSSQEYMNDLEEEFYERAILSKSKRPTEHFEGKYNKVKAKLALLSSSTSASKSSMFKNKGLITKAYEWDEDDMSLDDNEMVEVKVLMALADDENVVVGKERARNDESIKISMRKYDIRNPILYLDSGCSRHMTGEVIENGATLRKTTTVEDVMTVMPITTAKEKAQRRLDMKARSTLMMGIPNEHQLKFNFIKDAKKLLEAVEKRFGGNAATRKTQRNLLKNKADLDTMSMDDLYNNLKVYEPEVKGTSSSSSSTQNMAFVSSSNNNTSSTNKAVNTAHRVSTASTQVNVSNSTNIDNLSDAVICAFFASQPNSPQLIYEDLQ
ncbi:hypothetical protein Tco_1533407 [Tanacetum coccineum]